MLRWRQRKSAGVPVSEAAHRLIGKGNRARAALDWAAAAEAYAGALVVEPKLTHIWIQLGHTLGEAGRADEADAAYGRAAALTDAVEPWLHRGHLARRRGDAFAAGRAFLAVARSGDGEALTELHSFVHRLVHLDRAVIARAVTRPAAGDDAVAAMLDRLAGPAEAARVVAGAGTALVFDMSDLIAHFRHRRLPTGIQRVQVEVAARALRHAGRPVRICCFVDGRDDLIEIPTALFVELAFLSKTGTDEAADDWVDATTRLFIHLAVAEPLAFGAGDWLVNLGTSWWIHNYFLLVREAKRRHGIRLAAFVHDCIPVMAPEHCVTGVIEDYVTWLIGAERHTDLFLANSRSTARDLARATARLGRPVPEAAIEVVPLDADFRAAEPPADPAALGRWGLAGRPFALFVSTIESRKNHLLALEAWASRLADGHSAPQLVCVGRNGWLNDAFFSRLAADPLLARHVTIIERVNDAELALLYRACAFTVYPSHYEGWGLPVTESLSWGKLPLAADNSSLAEAGAGLALMFESGSAAALRAALDRAIDQPDWRAEREAEIAARFRPRPWRDVADQILAAIAGADGTPAADPTPAAMPGRYYPVTRPGPLRLWRGLESGETFRGEGSWLWPTIRGCRLGVAAGILRPRPEVPPATLRIALADVAPGPLRLYLRLIGLDGDDARYRVSAGGVVLREGVLEAGALRWVSPVVLPAELPRPLEVAIEGLTSEPILMTTGGTEKEFLATIGVAGFYICFDDEAGPRPLIEAMVLGGLAELDAYGEPAGRLPVVPASSSEPASAVAGL